MMFIQIIAVAALALSFEISAQECPQGGKIYTQGVTAEGQTELLKAHNDYRNLIMAGKVQGQPKGVGLKTITYDDALAKGATAVSKKCQMEHVVEDDPQNRFAVGQNLFISWDMKYTANQNWTQAIKSWFDEYVDFIYPTGSKAGAVTGHYTQVVWADTNLIGCDFIAYEDKGQPSFPYAKLYTCNYGPAGNFRGQAPYKKA